MDIEVLHAALECDAKVGGVGAVTQGLTAALAKKNYSVSIVTPGYDVYFNKHFKDKNIELLCTIPHIYKGEIIESNLFRVIKEVEGKKINHYLIRPKQDSPFAQLFDIHDDKNIYQSFAWSESRNRLEYLNGAIAAMLRLPNPSLPSFNLYHAHTWHTGLACVLAKEMQNLKAWDKLCNNSQPLKNIPRTISTIHMLLEREHGDLRKPQDIKNLFTSVGLPADFANRFPKWQHYVSNTHLKQLVLAILYSDAVTMVSEGLVHEVTHGKGQGLDDLFQWLDKEKRLHGILNGIDQTKFDGTDPANLGKLALIRGNVAAGKQQIKQELAQKYPKLNPNKMWFCFIARFAAEKGMDMLHHALDAITKADGMFIIMGSHVVTKKLPDGSIVPFYKDLIDDLRKHPNVVVIDDLAEQKIVGTKFRAAADWTTMFPHNEACGLPQIENFGFATAAIGPRIQGIPDSIKDLDEDPHGSGFLYDDSPAVRVQNLKAAINKAVAFHQKLTKEGKINLFLDSLLDYAKQFDWGDKSIKKYCALYSSLLQQQPSIPTFAKTSTMQEKKLFTGPAITFSRTTPTPTTAKIFQIGFNKCATQSLYTGFKKSGVAAVHYGVRGKTLASTIFANHRNGKPLLSGIDDFQAYFDMEDIYHNPPLFTARDLFKELDKQYPGSKFIFNTRDQEKWIQSRLAHIDPQNNKRYVDVLCAQYKCNVEELVQRWRQEWNTHHAAVREYFKDRPDDVIEYNLDKDDPEKLCKFFSNLPLDASLFKVVNKTPNATH